MERQLRELSMQTLLSPSELPALRKYRDLLDAKIEELEREGVTGLDGETMRPDSEAVLILLIKVMVLEDLDDVLTSAMDDLDDVPDFSDVLTSYDVLVTLAMCSRGLRSSVAEHATKLDSELATKPLIHRGGPRLLASTFPNLVTLQAEDLSPLGFDKLLANLDGLPRLETLYIGFQRTELEQQLYDYKSHLDVPIKRAFAEVMDAIEPDDPGFSESIHRDMNQIRSRSEDMRVRCALHRLAAVCASGAAPSLKSVTWMLECGGTETLSDELLQALLGSLPPTAALWLLIEMQNNLPLGFDFASAASLAMDQGADVHWRNSSGMTFCPEAVTPLECICFGAAAHWEQRDPVCPANISEQHYCMLYEADQERWQNQWCPLVRELMLRGASHTRFTMLELATETPMAFRAEDCERLCTPTITQKKKKKKKFTPTITHELAFPRGTSFRHGYKAVT